MSRATLAAAAVFVLVVGALFARARGLAGAAAGPPTEAAWALQDYRDAVDQPVRAWREGVNPYDARAYRAARPLALQGYPPYAPHHLLLHAPFTVPPYGAARWVYFGFVAALALVLARTALLGVAGRATAAATLAWGVLLLAGRPGHMNLVVGNVAAQMSLATWLALEEAERRPRAAGFWSMVAWAKPTFGLPLALLLLARGRWRAVAWGAALSAVLTALVLARLLLAPGGVDALLAPLTGHGESAVGVKGVLESWARIDVSALVAYVAGRDPGAWGQAALAALVLGGAALVLRAGRSAGAVRVAPLADPRTHLCLVAVLACGYHQAYDAMLLLPVLVTAWRQRAWGLFLVALVPFANYGATSTLLPRIDGLGVPALGALVRAANAVALVTLAVASTARILRGRPAPRG